MNDTDQPRFIGIALMGLLFIAFGITMLFAFAMKTAGMDLPEPLEFRSEPYNLLLLGIVNIGATVGILHRSKSVWSVTMVFIAVIMIGDLMDIFFTGNTKIVVFILYLAVLMYMMSKECRLWYNVG